jgi:hypothetical protein
MRYLLCCIAIAAALGGGRASAQRISNEEQIFINQMASAIENMVREGMAKFTPQLTTEERSLVQLIQIRVDRRNWQLSPGADIDAGGNRTITFPMGYIYGADMMDRAILEMTLLDEQELESYMRYVRRTLRQRELAYRTGGTPSPIKAYCEYLDHSQGECEALRLEESYKLQLTAIKFAGLAVVLGHELGHHFKGHIRNSTRKLADMEWEADRFGVSLSIRAGINPMLGMGTFAFAGSLLMDLPGSNSDDPHPKPLCRAILAMQAGIDDAERDPRFQAQRQALFPIRTQLSKIRAQEGC